MTSNVEVQRMKMLIQMAQADASKQTATVKHEVKRSLEHFWYGFNDNDPYTTDRMGIFYHEQMQKIRKALNDLGIDV